MKCKCSTKRIQVNRTFHVEYSPKRQRNDDDKRREKSKEKTRTILLLYFSILLQEWRRHRRQHKAQNEWNHYSFARFRKKIVFSFHFFFFARNEKVIFIFWLAASYLLCSRHTHTVDGKPTTMLMITSTVYRGRFHKTPKLFIQSSDADFSLFLTVKFRLSKSLQKEWNSKRIAASMETHINIIYFMISFFFFLFFSACYFWNERKETRKSGTHCCCLNMKK